MKIKSIKKLLPTFIFSLVCANSTLAFEKPVLLAEQGSFFAGGSVLQSEGAFDYDNPMNTAGQTLHGDHAYVFYQKPVNAHKYSLVFLHGAGQSGKTWESTPDGRDGFQNIFLERGYSTYVLDQPRRGKAGQSTVSVSITPATVDQMWFTNFRVGDYPKYFDGVQFAKDKNTLNQYLRQMTPNTGTYDAEVGIKGNTHFPFSDLNNVAIANLMEAWLQEKGLSK